MNPLIAGREEIKHDPAFQRLKRHVIEATGLAFYADKDDELAAHVSHRIDSLQVPDYDAYLQRLLDERPGDAELGLLANLLTIGETFFFRHQELFDALAARVIPELIERNWREHRLRIWSAGCAIGAEPYSLAIVLRRNFAAQLADWEIEIVATDINRQALSEAERGTFSEWTLRGTPDGIRDDCFVAAGANWAVRDEYRKDVTFRFHNLVQHPFPTLTRGLSDFDLILCRNVMIYFAPDVTRRLVGQFFDALGSGGWLLVGASEPSIDLFRAFRTVNVPGAVLYQKPIVGYAALQDLYRSHSIEPPLTFGSSALERTRTAPPGTFLAGQPVRRTRPIAESTVANAPTTVAAVRDQLNQGQFRAASDGCHRLMSSEPLNPLVHFLAALVAEQQGRSSDAETALRRAIYLDRGLVLAHYHLGLALKRKHDQRGAQRAFGNVLALLEQRGDFELVADELTVGELRKCVEMHLEAAEHR